MGSEAVIGALVEGLGSFLFFVGAVIVVSVIGAAAIVAIVAKKEREKRARRSYAEILQSETRYDVPH